jgi:DNA-binding response OmpR family regulator
MTKETKQPDATKILVVEDDEALSMQVKLFLINAGYDVSVASSGREASFMLEQLGFDLLLLDWKLPDCEGIDICQALRSHGRTMPVIMLTAEAELENKLQGFACGVDDYLTKPFAPRELLARVKTILARPPAMASDEFQVGNLQIKIRTAEVYLNGAKLPLLPKEFALLEFFVRHPNQYFDSDSLLSHVWKADAAVGVATVRVQINNLRKKLSTEGRHIQNSPGLGYRLVLPKRDDN